MSRPRRSIVLDVDGDPVRLCGVAGDLSEDDRAALAEIIRAAKRKLAESPLTPEQETRQYHRQCPRPDGTWGCRCGWIQDKPHRDHVADMIAAARCGRPECQPYAPGGKTPPCGRPECQPYTQIGDTPHGDR